MRGMYFPFISWWGRFLPGLVGVAACLLLAARTVRADQVEMQNGDRYVGTVLALNSETLTLRSEILGTVVLPRGRIARISLGSGNPGSGAPATVGTNTCAVATDPAPARLPALPELPTATNSVEQLPEQLLANATPAARSKFRDLALGYMTGKVSVNDIRAEAKTAVEQLKALRAELGDEADASFDTYLSILENFLNDTKSTAAAPPATNAAPQPKANSQPP